MYFRLVYNDECPALDRRLYALAEPIATYEPLWAWLGGTYTLHGGLMVVGGLTFGWWALRAWWR